MYSKIFTWHPAQGIQAGVDRLVVSRTANLQLLTHEIYSIESHSGSCFVNRAELDKSKIFVEIDLTSENWITRSLSQTTQVHLKAVFIMDSVDGYLLVEEVQHCIFVATKRNVSDIQTTRLTSN